MDFLFPFYYLVQIDMFRYIFGAFALFGVMLGLRKIIFQKGI